MVKSGSLIFFMISVVVCLAQRSPYAPKPFVYPDVLPQYTTTQDPNNLDNRFGEGGTTQSTTTTTGIPLPGSLQEQEFINRVSEWPDDKKPFWFVNNQHLAGHRGYNRTTTSGTTQRPQQQPQQQSQQQPQQPSQQGRVQVQQPGGRVRVIDRQDGFVDDRFNGGGSSWRRQEFDPEDRWITFGARRRDLP